MPGLHLGSHRVPSHRPSPPIHLPDLHPHVVNPTSGRYATAAALLPPTRAAFGEVATQKRHAYAFSCGRGRVRR